MWSAAFSASMMVGRVRLPVVIERHDRGIDHAQALDADDARLRVDHRHRIGRTLPIRQVPQGW